MREWLNTTGREYARCDDVVEFRDVAERICYYFAEIIRKDKFEAYHCPHCGWEGYFLIRSRRLHFDAYTIRKELDIDGFNRRSPVSYKECEKIGKRMDAVYADAEKCRTEFAQKSICPCCGNSLPKEKGYYAQNIRWEDWMDEETDDSDETEIEKIDSLSDNPIINIEDVFEDMRKSRDAARTKRVQKIISENVQQFDVPMPCSVDVAKAKDVKDDPGRLKQYVQQLVKLESAIYLEQQMLEWLLNMQLDMKGAEIRDKYLADTYIETQLSGYADAVKKAEASYKKSKKKLDDLQKQPMSYQPITLPKPRQPKMPVLGVPGFFNKKRVEAENKELLENYRKLEAEWKKRVNKIEQEEKVLTEKRNAENEERAKKIAQEYEPKVASKKLALDEAKKDLKKKKKELSNAVVSKVEAYRCELVEQELEQSKKTLQELFKCRNELYACDIVFPKYRSLVALSVICEYLMTGRCSTLEGADGAYNLYESELRSNLIIAELAIVIESLEQIKRNQYMLYAEMQSINASLSAMHTTMVDMHRTLESIEGNTEVLAKNSAVIAHNTAVTAHYAKVNAELTNALGFLVALK